YSSGIYEFALLNKPMIFYAYDIDEYKKFNQFYCEYEEFVPGPIVKTQEELINVIKTKKHETYDIKKFAEENFDYMDGKSSERFIASILSDK
ncbi:MAG: CDP-glycerol glycerophosphotransferase family protein, partial [Eubacteriaceae bacterium]